LRRFILLGLVLFLFYNTWPTFGSNFEKSQYGPVITKLKSEINDFTKNREYATAIDTFFNGIHQILLGLNNKLEQDPKNTISEQKKTKKPELTTPTVQTFSVFNIELGDTKEEIESLAGTAKRSSFNEYGIQWYAYHEDYQNFFMAAYDKNNKVVGLYTNQDLISSKNGIKRGVSKSLVREKFGEPLTKIKKENVYYQFQENQDYDIFMKDGSYITIFYDKHNNNTVTSIQLINERLEENKRDFYTVDTPLMMEGFEFQLFDLTNAARVNRGLSILDWNEHVKLTARKHSEDMAENNYFNHTSPDGKSPFDRMKDDNVTFTYAGENLAYGQLSSVYAHEGLMNSKGHRDNILRQEFEYLGVGVAFNEKSQPYYTENFFAN
jgi:uncharacterized protein YkwD